MESEEYETPGGIISMVGNPNATDINRISYNGNRQSGEVRLVRIALQPTIIPNDHPKIDEAIQKKIIKYIECVLQEFELHIKLYNLVLNNESITEEHVTNLIENIKNRYPDVITHLHLDLPKNIQSVVQKLKSHCTKSNYKKCAESIEKLISNFSLDNKEILIKGCLLIFFGYEMQFLSSFVDSDNDKALMILASEAVRRILNICIKEKVENITLYLIKEGIVDHTSESKLTERLIKLKCTNIGHGDDIEIKDRNGKNHNVSALKIYTNVGLMKEGDIGLKYYKTKGSNTTKFGYRRLFEGEDLPLNVHEEDNKHIDYNYKITNIDDIDIDLQEIIQNAKRNYTKQINERIDEEINHIKDIKDFALKIILPLLALNEDYTIFNEWTIPKIETIPNAIEINTGLNEIEDINEGDDDCTVRFNLKENVVNFVGREKYIKKIDELFAKDKCRVVVSGDAYIGKTEFVLKYANEKQSLYKNIIFLSSECIKTSFLDLAFRLGVYTMRGMTRRCEENIIEDIFDCLKYRKSLLIYDNVTDINAIKKYIPVGNNENVYIIITTRLKKMESYDIVSLHAFEKLEAYNFAYQQLEKYINMEIKHSHKEKLIKDFVQRIEYFPITINAACAYVIEETKVGSNNPMGDYIKEYKTIHEEHRKTESFEYFSDRYLRKIFISLRLSLKRIKRFDDNALDILKACAYLNPKRTTTDDLYQIFIIFDKETIDKSLSLLRTHGILDVNQHHEIKINSTILDIVRDMSQNDNYNYAYQKVLFYSVRYNYITFHSINLIEAEEYIHSEYILKYADSNLEVVKSLIFQSNDYDLAQLYFLTGYYGCLEVFKLVFDKIVEMTRIKEGFGMDPVGYIRQTEVKNGIEYEGCVTTLVCFRGHLELLKFLIDKGASVHTQCKKRYLLHYAAYSGHDSIVKYLIDNEANWNVKDCDGLTILHIAASKGYPCIIDILIDRKVNLNQPNEISQTALHLAALNGHSLIVETLLFYEAEVDPINRDEQTPLHLAVVSGKLTIVEHLISANSDINKIDKNDSTPLHIAVENSYTKIAQLLIDKGAKTDMVDYQGRTVLHLSVINNDETIVTRLLNLNVDVNLADDKGNTPLHDAAQNGNLRIVRMLLLKGAFVNASNCKGSLPLHRAAKYANLEVVKLLLEFGADMFHTDFDGRTAVQDSARFGNQDVVQLLLKKQSEISEALTV